MYELDLDKYKDLPPIRHVYSAGGSYCALAKLMVACGVEPPTPFGEGGFYQSSPATADFISGITSKVQNKNWAREVMEINDADGDLRVNHERAFRLAVNTAVESGLVKLKNSTNALA